MTEYLYGQHLWQRVRAVTESALANGALQAIPTHCQQRQVRHAGAELNFQIRVVDNLARKTREQRERIAQAPQPQGFNPFLPYDPALYVGELTEHYRCLLNKFNVVDHHILLVTTRFVTQQAPLDREDFLAAALCLQAQNGLVFYNGGTAAGASVEHRHLQMIPLPLSPATSFPLAKCLSRLSPMQKGITPTPPPFALRVTRAAFTADATQGTLTKDAEINCQAYQQLLHELGLIVRQDGLMPPHNMLLTRDFLWVVPRIRESYQGLPVNALGFAGTFLMKDEVQLQQLDQTGCLELLKAVATSN